MHGPRDWTPRAPAVSPKTSRAWLLACSVVLATLTLLAVAAMTGNTSTPIQPVRQVDTPQRPSLTDPNLNQLPMHPPGYCGTEYDGHTGQIIHHPCPPGTR